MHAQQRKLGTETLPFRRTGLSAGAAKACGGLQNLPTGKEAKELAVLLYGDDRGKDALYGPRDDRLLEQIGLPSSYDHLYVWLADETADGKGGYIRMFADKGSIPYYARREARGMFLPASD